MDKIVKKTTRLVKSPIKPKLELSLVKDGNQAIVEIPVQENKIVAKIENKIENKTEPMIEETKVEEKMEEKVEPVQELKIESKIENRQFNTNNKVGFNKNPVGPMKASINQRTPELKALSIKDLDEKSIVDLRKIASTFNIYDIPDYNKNDLIIKILEKQTERGGNIFAEGVLEIINDGSHGVLRSLKMVPGANDVYVSGSQIKRFNLRPGDFISGQARAPKEGERYLSLLRIEAINNVSPEMSLSRKTFQKLTPIFPNKMLKLETESHVLSTRLIDLLAPIGKGQRGMIVAPPKAGKTWLLKEIANGIAVNHPEVHLMVVLIGERPEEVTDLERFVKGEVVAANFDEPPETHTRVAELAIERAKRLVELGKDVVILMDSITRLARAYNITAPPSGRTLSGGFDPVAIYPPKKFFGAARNFEVGGSLTIIATSLVETGSRMDEVIFEEFKGTGNMELKLDRKLQQRRIYPAIDVKASSTRNDDLLLTPEVLNQSWRVRRMIDVLKEDDATSMLIERLKKTKNNAEFLATLHEDR
jgi:transcription termination factor Rho